MSANPSLYRFIDFIGGNILDASNVTLLQTELNRLGIQGLGQLYAQGALLNAVFNVTGTTITFTKANSAYDVFALVNGQFEDLGATISIAGTQPTTGSSNPLFLNWSWDIKTSSDDPTFIDGITGEPTIQTGQLSIQVSWTDTSGVSLNPSIQFGKNTAPIILANFDMSSPGTVVPTYINGTFPYGWGTSTQAGIVRLSTSAVWVASTDLGVGVRIVDSNGNIQQITTAGITGSSVPTWNVTTSGTTTDGTATWTNEGPAVLGEVISINDISVTNARNPKDGSVRDVSVASLISSGFNSSALPAWIATHAYTISFQIVDSNGNVQTVVGVSGTGTSGSTHPTWATTIGSQTIDNAGSNQIIWVNGGSAATVKYDPTTTGQGGITTDKIIYTTLTEKLTDFLDSVNANIATTLQALANHIGQPLGSAATHPFPTAFQVGAAPASHVGQTLGLGTSHPAQVNSDHAGFIVLRNPAVNPAFNDYAYLITDGSNPIVSLNHSGDGFFKVGASYNAQGLNGTGGPANFRGVLGAMGLLNAVVAEHVNYNAHGNNNPHGLSAADLGAASQAYVDATVQTIIADVTAYTDAKSQVSTRVVTTAGPTFPVEAAGQSVLIGQNGVGGGNNPAGNTAVNFPTTAASITYVIFNIGGAFEVAFGFGEYATGQQVALPETTGWTSGNWLGSAAPNYMINVAHDEKGFGSKFFIPQNTRIVQGASSVDSSGAPVYAAICGIHAVGWRNITPNATIISAFDTVSNTFNQGSVGHQVVITGRNFGASQGSSTIKFNGVNGASVTQWIPNQIVCTIPSTTSGVIQIKVGTQTAVNSPFVFTIV